jgi:hypothetical protein
MRIIDANTGTEVEIGRPFRNVDGVVNVLKVDEGIFSAKALVQINQRVISTPLVVRYLHPRFMFQKVAFIPS